MHFDRRDAGAARPFQVEAQVLCELASTTRTERSPAGRLLFLKQWPGVCFWVFLTAPQVMSGLRTTFRYVWGVEMPAVATRTGNTPRIARTVNLSGRSRPLNTGSFRNRQDEIGHLRKPSNFLNNR